MTDIRAALTAPSRVGFGLSGIALPALVATFPAAATAATAGTAAVYAARERVAAGSGTGRRATHMSAFSVAGPWRGVGAPTAAGNTGNPGNTARVTAVNTAPATAIAAVSDKRFLVKKNGTQLYKGSSPWRFPV
jgi:hypothetical protein